MASADYIWPRIMNGKIRELVTANGGEIVGEEYFPSNFFAPVLARQCLLSRLTSDERSVGAPAGHLRWVVAPALLR